MKHAAFLLVSGICLSVLAGADALPAWRDAASLQSWTKWTCQCAEARWADGALRVVCGGSDAQIYSSAFDIPASSSQVVTFKAKGSRGGTGELFWMPPGKGPRQAWSVHFDWVGDGEWHEYRVRPYWQGEGRIGRLRLDFPMSAADGGVFEIAGLSVEDAGGAIYLPADRYAGVAFSLCASSNGLGEVRWASTGMSGLQKTAFRVPGDGRVHRHYLNLSDHRAWLGRITHLEVCPPPGVARPADVAPVKEAPDFPPDLLVRSAGMSDAFNRVGAPVPLTVRVDNLGTRAARNVRLTAERLPEGVRFVNAQECAGRTVHGLDGTTFAPVLECAAAGTFTAVFTVRDDSGCATSVSAPVTVLPSLNLPKASYVPPPQPVETDYDVAALYFPGWNRIEAWQRVWKVCPERKPVLGWYDEANPEVVDWQIKWLVENGIRTLYVDWYWCRGGQSLDHWVKAFQKARYRSHLKWAMMWANHNAAGSHSVEDQRNVTRFWIENYFNTPEYLQIDGKPVVWLWSPQNMDRDVKDGGCRRLLEVSREMARAAGYKGIHFIAMKWPEADCSPKTIRKYRDMGFDMTGIYHFMDPGAYEPYGRRFSYSSVARANPENWRAQHKAGVLPFLPNLSTGWDDRPWNDHCEIYGKNVADFRRICEEAKRFADETGVRRLCLAPLNEWGEGSYAEPNAEHGFGFYEAVRDVFCKKPAGGWPVNFAPKDVGLGPYDLPPPKPPRRVTEWTFTGGDAQEWHPMMGVADWTASDAGLAFRTSTRDPAICASFLPFDAKAFTKAVVRMKVEGGGETSAQLFWSGPQTQVREQASVSRKITADGAFRDVEFPLSGCRAWRGRVSHFRFDPANSLGLKVVVQSIRLER